MKLTGLFFLLLFTFTYFTQGGGFNQNAFVGEIRETVEHGHVNINNWTGVTGDVSQYKDKIYSNKQPSFFFFVVPIYFALDRIVNFLPIDKTSQMYQLFVTHFITFWSASIWGALFGIVFFLLAKELYPQATERQLLIFTLISSLGSMVFEFSTVAFVHAFETFWVFCAFYLWILFLRQPRRGQLVFSAVTYGLMLLGNPILVLSAPVVYFVLFKRKIPFQDISLWSICVALPLVPLLIYNKIHFDSFLSGNRNHLVGFTDAKLFMGVFGSPVWQRMYAIYIDSNKSLFPANIPAIFGIASCIWFLMKKKCNTHEMILPIAIFAIYNIVILTFNGWHGGACYGPRYMIPAVMLLYLASFPVLDRWPRIYIAAGLFSCAIYLIVTATHIFTGENEMHPLVENILPPFLRGELVRGSYPIFPGMADIPAKYNLGYFLGLTKHATLIPLLVVQAYVIRRLLQPTNQVFKSFP